MNLERLSLAVAFSSAMFLGGCAQTQTAQPAAESSGSGRYNIKVYATKESDAYRNWDEEGKKLCKGGFTTSERFMIKGADGREYLTGNITCSPAKK